MCPNPLETTNLVRFTGEILNGERHFLCSDGTVLKEKILLILSAAKLVFTLNISFQVTLMFCRRLIFY